LDVVLCVSGDTMDRSGGRRPHTKQSTNALRDGLADGQREFLHGVIEFYQTRTSTHMTIAAEKSAATAVQQNEDMRQISAWVAMVAAPTAVTGFVGQNIPYPGFGSAGGVIASSTIIIIAMAMAMAMVLFIFFKRRRWL
jgi:magnesium transporter